MDDDLTFSTSVWGIDDVVLLPAKPSLSSKASSDDQLDDFDNLAQTMHDTADDDFGDFGDFGETELAGSVEFEDEIAFGAGVQTAESSGWQSLRVDPLPSRSELIEQLNDILKPIWDYEDLPSIFSDEEIREAEGVGQILMTPESRELFKMLVQSTPPTKPPNWTRSRIRRQHLIALGIPVNLDEVLPRANGKPLPPLQITTRPMSAPPVARNSVPQNNVLAFSGNSRSGTPQPDRPPTPPSHFGPKPELDHFKIQKLLELDRDTLTMQPLASIERHLADLRAQTASVSTLLTHLLQMRESLQQDNETYNGLIADLVGEAQKMKSGKPRTGTVKRGSQMG